MDDGRYKSGGLNFSATKLSGWGGGGKISAQAF